MSKAKIYRMVIIRCDGTVDEKDYTSDSPKSISMQIFGDNRDTCKLSVKQNLSVVMDDMGKITSNANIHAHELLKRYNSAYRENDDLVYGDVGIIHRSDNFTLKDYRGLLNIL